jgi:hypothetical protein
VDQSFEAIENADDLEAVLLGGSAGDRPNGGVEARTVASTGHHTDSQCSPSGSRPARCYNARLGRCARIVLTAILPNLMATSEPQ